MGNLFSLRQREIGVHMKFATNLKINNDQLNEWKLAAPNFWTTVQPESHVYRQVYAFLDKKEAHASLAINDEIQNDASLGNTLIVFHIRGTSFISLHVDVYPGKESIEIFFPPEKTKIIPITRTKLSNQQLGQLALRCKPPIYEHVFNDCVKFVRNMAEEIAVNENGMTLVSWKPIKDQILVYQSKFGQKKEDMARNGWPKAYLAKTLGLLPNNKDKLVLWVLIGIFVCIILIVFELRNDIFALFAW